MLRIQFISFASCLRFNVKIDEPQRKVQVGTYINQRVNGPEL